MNAVHNTAGAKRIFIVDDHPLVRDWLANLIAQEPGLEFCGQAEDAETALAQVKDVAPDVVIVDLSLKHSSGLELIKDLRRTIPDAQILVLSMHEEMNYVERAFRAGAQGYVVKRESGSCVVDAIRAVLDGQRYASSALMSPLVGRLFGSGAEKPVNELLSDRELEVFQLRGEGRGTKEIAEYIQVSIKTVESYDARIKEKLGLQSAGELLREAVRWNDRRHGL